MRQISCVLVLLALLTPKLLAGGPDVTFRSGEVFEMRLSGMPLEEAQQFAQQYTVSSEGTINVPLIGEVKALGLTTAQLERTIQNRLVSEKIFTQPTVIISMAQGTRIVSVSGGVKNPARLTWNVDLKLSTAVSECGGPSDFGDPKKIRIVRDSKVLGIFSLPEIQKDPAKDLKLLPGDQVIVKE